MTSIGWLTNLIWFNIACKGVPRWTYVRAFAHLVISHYFYGCEENMVL